MGGFGKRVAMNVELNVKQKWVNILKVPGVYDVLEVELLKKSVYLSAYLSGFHIAKSLKLACCNQCSEQCETVLYGWEVPYTYSVALCTYCTQ